MILVALDYIALHYTVVGIRNQSTNMRKLVPRYKKYIVPYFKMKKYLGLLVSFGSQEY